MEEFLLNIRSELIKNNYNSINEINLKKERNICEIYIFVNTSNQNGDHIKKKLILKIEEILDLKKINNFVKEYTKINKEENKTIFEFKNKGSNYLFKIKKTNYKNGDFLFTIRGDFSLKTISDNLKVKDMEVIYNEKLIWNF